VLERPIRQGRVSVPRVIVVACLGALLSLGIASLGTVTTQSSTSEDGGVAPANDSVGVAAPVDFFTYDPDQNPPPTMVMDDPALRLLMIGDSAAFTISNGYEQRTSDPPILLWDRTIVGCTLFAGERHFESIQTDGGPQCAASRADRGRWLSEFRPDVIAISSGVWKTYDRVIDGRDLAFGSRAFDSWFAAELDDLLRELDDTGAEIAILTAPCNQRAEAITGVEPPENDGDRVAHLNRLFQAGADRHPGTATSIDLHELVCPDRRYLSSLDGVALRQDGVHFTLHGAERLRALLYPRLGALAG